MRAWWRRRLFLIRRFVLRLFRLFPPFAHAFIPLVRLPRSGPPAAAAPEQLAFAACTRVHICTSCGIVWLAPCALTDSLVIDYACLHPCSLDGLCMHGNGMALAGEMNMDGWMADLTPYRSREKYPVLPHCLTANVVDQTPPPISKSVCAQSPSPSRSICLCGVDRANLQLD